MRKPCLGILCCAAPGILLSEHFPCSPAIAGIAVLCFALAAWLGRSVVPFCLLVFTIFFIRHELDWRRNPGRLPLDLAEQGRGQLYATGIVTSDPLPAGYAMHEVHWRFEMQVATFSATNGVIRADCPVEVYWTGPAPAWGDEVTLAADVSTLPLPRNPGEFDVSAFLSRSGIDAELSCRYAADCRVLAHDRGNPVLAMARTARAWLERRLTEGIRDDPEIAGLVETITLGLKEETSVSDRELFQHVGAIHLFVVNGLHIALLAGILALLLKPLGIRRRAFALAVIPILLAYAAVTGFSPGSVRAAIMAAVMYGASFVERQPLSFNSLAAAALLLLAWDTNEWFKEGFQFSFGVVAAIILLAGWIERPLLPLGLPDPFLPRVLWTRWQRAREAGWRSVSRLCAVSLAASAGSFPFSAGYLSLITPSALVANLLLVPAAFAILFEGIFSLLTSFAAPVALLFNNANWALASGMLAVVHFFALLPGGYFFVSTSGAAPPLCRLTVLDLAPGQAIGIESQGHAWLVDCGDDSAYRLVVRPWLESRGINRLDGLILTRGASGSMGAAQELIAEFAPRQICESALPDKSPARRALHAALEQAGMPKTILEPGEELELSAAARCEVLFPPVDFQGRTASDKSLVLRVQEGRESVLLMGESGYAGEHWLLDHRAVANGTVVVLGGQSQDMAGTGEFLSAAHAFAVVRGEQPFAGSPERERAWVAGCYRGGVRPVVQSAAGAVTVELAPSSVTVTGYANGQRLASSRE